MFFSSWDVIFQTSVIGALAYLSVIVLLRVSGKRTLSEMNAFDLVVSVAIGSVLSTTILESAVKLSDGIVAIAVPKSNKGIFYYSIFL